MLMPFRTAFLFFLGLLSDPLQTLLFATCCAQLAPTCNMFKCAPRPRRSLSVLPREPRWCWILLRRSPKTPHKFSTLGAFFWNRVVGNQKLPLLRTKPQELPERHQEASNAEGFRFGSRRLEVVGPDALLMQCRPPIRVKTELCWKVFGLGLSLGPFKGSFSRTL